MTREEAIKRLYELQFYSSCKVDERANMADIWRETVSALDMAIAALNQSLPCKIGDIAYGISRSYGRVRIVPAKVTQMFYSDDMELCMVVENACRGKFGEAVFLTREEAEEAVKLLTRQ